jgi:hypothetical protein
MGASEATANQLRTSLTPQIEIFEVFEENWLAFSLFKDEIWESQLLRFGAMGGVFGFDWHQIKAHPLIPDLSKEDWQRLVFIERIITNGLNKTDK